MKSVTVTFSYPETTGSGLNEKVLDMTQIELVALLICDTLHSEGKYYDVESKIFEDVNEGGQVFIRLKKAGNE